MGIREKLLDYKRRLSDRRMYSIVIVIIGIVAVWGFSQYKQAANLKQKLENQYNRAFYDMVGYVNNVEMLLIKSMITATPQKTASIMQDAWRQATLAQVNLGQLPMTPQTLANTSKYLVQVGDLAYVLNQQNMNGKPLSNAQYATIEKLYGYATSLDKSLSELQSSFSEGRMKWGELQNKGELTFKKVATNQFTEQFENMEKTFQDYPTLIYDGPFSDHLTSAQPKGLKGEGINSEQGKEKVKAFFGADKIASVEYTGKVDAEPIKTYNYTVTFKNTPEDQKAQISVTQKGGHVLWMLYPRPSGSKKLDVEKAKEIGRKFLESRGYAGMVDTYYTKEDNTATINYAYSQDEVTIYPDLIKVKIALDQGEIIGYEAKGYLSAHEERTIPSPKLSLSEAKAKINNRVEVLSSGSAIIPTDFNTELYTYEFKGKLNEKDFLVYINAETGKEEKILMIINTEQGILTL